MSGSMRRQSSGAPGQLQEPDTEPLRALPPFSMDKWAEELKNVRAYETDVHHLVLNYLTISGLAGPAQEFAREANIRPEMPLHAISGRARIREAVLSGRTEEAIEQIKLIDPKILETNAEVNFLLQKQQLLQLIEQGDPNAAIDFAQQHLAPCVKQCPHVLPQLEEAMALLGFSDLECLEARRLMGGMEKREEMARLIDEAILDLYGVQHESALELLVKNILYTERYLRNAQPSLCPMVQDLVQGKLGLSSSRSRPAVASRGRNSSSSSTGEAALHTEQEEQGSSGSRGGGRQREASIDLVTRRRGRGSAM